ncbi:MAG TPA: hypothetical protein VFA99_13555 [Acidobacteriaceae bacterium]|nr:hypothetical protein [Acidobacteriaceae bacterium]
MVRASEQTEGSACRVGGRLIGACVAAALVMLSAAAWGAERNADKRETTIQPWVTMSLGTLGVPSIPQAFLQVGSSMLTLDVVDDTHLLLTFSSRGLVPRDPSDSPDEECRMVAAELVELPTGTIVARADWKMHDHGRYLWRMGKGRFLVRRKNDLFVLTPEARLHTADPLRLIPFPKREGIPVSAMISPDKSMLTVETIAPKTKDRVLPSKNGMIVSDPRQVVMVDFYRVSGGDAPDVPLTLKTAGVVKAPEPVLLPMDGDGYLWPADGGRGRWPVTFNEFGGREVKITQLDSSCLPRLQMVSRFEFLAFTCRTSDARSRMQSFGMDGHETWEETLNGTFGVPDIVYAPEAGRFALSRIVSSTGDLMLGSMIPDGASQEVRVYQTESGDLLLKVPTTPVTRFAENFDLSEDGLVAAVVNAGAVLVYKLPPPSAQDVKDLALARSFSPPASEAQVTLAKMVQADEAEADAPPATNVASAAAPVAPRAGSGVASAAPAPAVQAKKEDVSLTTGGAGGGGGIAAGGGKAAAADAAASSISDAEAMAAMRKDAAGSSAKAAAGDAVGGDPAVAAETAATQRVAGPNGDSPSDDSAADAGSGADVRRKPPTLLEPGETVEKVKSPASQQSSR